MLSAHALLSCFVHAQVRARAFGGTAGAPEQSFRLDLRVPRAQKRMSEHLLILSGDALDEQLGRVLDAPSFFHKKYFLNTPTVHLYARADAAVLCIPERRNGMAQ